MVPLQTEGRFWRLTSIRFHLLGCFTINLRLYIGTQQRNKVQQLIQENVSGEVVDQLSFDAVNRRYPQLTEEGKHVLRQALKAV